MIGHGDRLPILAVEGPVGIEGLAVLVVEEKRGVGDLALELPVQPRLR